MLIVAKQDNINNLFAVWDTVLKIFLGTDLDYRDCIRTVMDGENCSYKDAKNKIDRPQPFDDIAKQIYHGFEPDYVQEETDIRIKNAVRLISNHYKSDSDFRNAFISSIQSALKDLPRESDLVDAAKSIADRIMGDESL